MIDESISALPLQRLIDEFNIPRQVLNEKIKTYRTTLLFHRPMNTTTWVSAQAFIPNSNEIQTITSIFQAKKGTPFSDTHDYCKKVGDDIKFFPIDSPDLEEITATGQVIKRSFKKAFLYSPSQAIEATSSISQFCECISPLRAIVVEADLFIASASRDICPEETTVTENQLFIQRDDALKIINEIFQSCELRREEWMSDDLFFLNQASIIFLAGSDITPENKISKLTAIKEWLMGRLSNQGNDLIHQTALSLLPAEHYKMTPKGTVSPDITKKYPAYASVSLVMINEAAIYFWELRNKNIQKNYAKKNEVIEYLTNEDHKMTRRLASAAFTIIKLPDLNITCPRDLAI